MFTSIKVYKGLGLELGVFIIIHHQLRWCIHKVRVRVRDDVLLLFVPLT